METLTLNDGTVLENTRVLTAGANALFVYVRDPEATLAGIFALMNDPGKTARMVASTGEDRVVFEGYTDFYTITKDERQISAGLMRPAQ